MPCSKQFSITVAGGGPCASFFDATPWGAPTIDSGCSGSFSGASFSASSTPPPDPGPGFCDDQQASCTAPLGTLLNPGDAFDCCLNLTVLANGGIMNISIFDFGSFTSVLNLTQADVVAGANVFPFTVPSGANLQVTVSVSSNTGDACAGGFGNQSVSGVFGNCP